MVAPLPVYSCHYHSVRVQDLVSRAALPYATISAISDATVLSDSHLSDQLRHRPPASACFSTPTTCSTEKRFLFTANLPFSGGRYCRKLTLVCIRNRGPLMAVRSLSRAIWVTDIAAVYDRWDRIC